MIKKFSRIFSGMIIMVFISKALGFFREALIANNYGASFVSDIYTFEEGILNAVYTVFAGVIATTYIPCSLSMDIERRKKFTNDYYNIFFVCIIFITILIILFADYLLKLLLPGFQTRYSNEIMSYVVFLTRINAASLVLIFIENFLIIVLQAKSYFIFTALQGIIMNTILIIYLLFLKEYEIYGIIISKIIGHIANIILLIVFIRVKGIMKYKLSFDYRSKDMKIIFRLGIPVVLSNIFSQLNYIVDRSMVSSLTVGSMSLLSYASLIASMLYAIFGISLNNIAYTDLSKNQHNSLEFKRIFSKYYNMFMGILIPACMVMMVNATSLSKMVFGRGKINEEDVHVISFLLLLYVPSNFAISLRDLYNRVLYIYKKTIIPSVINMLGLILNIIFNIILAKIWGIYGLAIATSLVSCLILFITKLYSEFYVERNYKEVFNVFIRSSITLLICCMIKCYCNNHGIINILSLIVASILALITYNFSPLVAYFKKGGQ